MEFKNLDQLASFQKLRKEVKPEDLKKVLTADRVKAFSANIGDHLIYNYAAKQISAEAIDILQELSNEQDLINKYKAILDGEYMNTGENRRVLHHLTRGQQGEAVVHEGKDLHKFYTGEQKKIYEFAAQIHSGQITSSTGKKFDTVVQIGIGGSDLGPRAMYLALENYVRTNTGIKMQAHFISNVDPDDANSILKKINFETTLFILVSKSGTTQETLANESFVKESMLKAGIPQLDPKGHMIAVTSETSPLAGNPDYLASFYIDDFIGGRYSSTSAVGGAVLALAFGQSVVEEFLQGAAQVDKLSLEKDVRKNPALLDALIGVVERNIFGYPTTAILPYSQALSRFPAHLQQADMESNGKTVNRRGEAVSYQTGPVIFGEPGTNGQHSFYQLLHQGTDIVPLQFIGFIDSQDAFDLEIEGSTSQAKLKANLAAQIIAFAKGKDDSNKNKNFAGQRPSSLIYGKQLTPTALGALLAHFENKILFQGLTWNINSFDQEGVQLGKLLAKQVLAKGDMDEALKSFSDLLQI
ncbi:glucose-6-phosphate isomerase [Spirochaeta cellobiosiphila]|uniref:glucose-6-phosphate isomerase n=1 Tax=Spirochaeta cellobiosiphila TaxID=504483 RepID=UPI00048D4132|nr:glucose-6-phosphate isomerase [Spirochaeta cellobiosiphila]